jgi:hypothetical protein
MQQQPDRVELSWDTGKSKWLVRIEAGAEVIRRYCDLAKDADDNTIRTAAQKTVQDEGFDVNPSSLTIVH